MPPKPTMPTVLPAMSCPSSHCTPLFHSPLGMVWFKYDSNYQRVERNPRNFVQVNFFHTKFIQAQLSPCWVSGIPYTLKTLKEFQAVYPLIKKPRITSPTSELHPWTASPPLSWGRPWCPQQSCLMLLECCPEVDPVSLLQPGLCDPALTTSSIWPWAGDLRIYIMKDYTVIPNPSMSDNPLILKLVSAASLKIRCTYLTMWLVGTVSTRKSSNGHTCQIQQFSSQPKLGVPYEGVVPAKAFYNLSFRIRGIVHERKHSRLESTKIDGATFKWQRPTVHRYRSRSSR